MTIMQIFTKKGVKLFDFHFKIETRGYFQNYELALISGIKCHGL